MSTVEIIIIVVAFGALVATWLLTRYRYATRISRLSAELDNIVRHREFRQRVTEGTRDDEFSRLERTVNDIFDAMATEERAEDDRDLLFRNIADGVHEAILVLRNRVIYANPRAAAMRGLRQDDLIGKPALELFHPRHREQVRNLCDATLGGKEVPERFEVEMINRAGEGVWVEARMSTIDYSGSPALVFTAFDVTERKHRLDKLARECDRASMTLHSIADGVITTDAGGGIDYMNSAAEKLLGCDLKSAAGRRLSELARLVDETDRKPLRDPVQQSLANRRRVSLGRRALLLANGEEYSMEVSVAPIVDAEKLRGTVIVLHDVTELRGLARRMSYQASHDALTGLINKREFERRVEEALGSARANDLGHVLAYLDLDRFKAVNDTCGHMAGDKMLREIAGLIRDKVRDSDTVARLGGDEFGLLLIGCPLDKARQIADDVCQVVEDYRFVWRDRIFQIGVSIGLLEITRASGSVADALSAADSACYIAKQGHTRVHVYSARDESVARHGGEIAWLQRLQQALRDERFELSVQPIVSVDGNVPDGPACEVLVRMLDEHNNPIQPGDFIAAAERYQLMPRIDRWVIRTALAALGSGELRLPEGRSCAINLSGQTIGDGQFLEYVVECLDTTGVAPDSVCFELTESSVSTNIGHARRFIEVLHGMGCRFALDDFGSGVGSLANLRDLSMDFIKIHGSFVSKLHDDSVSRAMVKSMVDLARTLDIRVVAEQVEDREALAAVRELGVDFVQGFAIGRPRPLAVGTPA